MQSGMSIDPSLLDSILSSLSKAGLYERAGDLYLYLGRNQAGFTAFRKGHAYRCDKQGRGCRRVGVRSMLSFILATCPRPGCTSARRPQGQWQGRRG